MLSIIALALTWVAGQDCDSTACRDGAACLPKRAPLKYVEFQNCEYHGGLCLCKWYVDAHLLGSTPAGPKRYILRRVYREDLCCAIHSGHHCGNPNGKAHPCFGKNTCFLVINTTTTTTPCSDKVDAFACKCMRVCADTHDQSKCLDRHSKPDPSCCEFRGRATCANGYKLSRGRRGCGGEHEAQLRALYGTCCEPARD